MGLISDEFLSNLDTVKHINLMKIYFIRNNLIFFYQDGSKAPQSAQILFLIILLIYYS